MPTLTTRRSNNKRLAKSFFFEIFQNMTATEQLELAYLLGAVNQVNMVKEAAKWDKLWRAGELDTFALAKGFMRGGPSGIDLSRFANMGGEAIQALKAKLQGAGIPQGRLGATSTHRAAMRDARNVITRSIQPQDILAARKPGSNLPGNSYSGYGAGSAAGFRMRTPNLP